MASFTAWSTEGANVLSNSLSNLGVQFKDAMQRQEQNAILQQQKEASAKIPGLIKDGDIPGAAQASFDAGDPVTGRQLLLSDLQRRQNAEQMTEIGKTLNSSPVNFTPTPNSNTSLPPIKPPEQHGALSTNDVVNLALKNGATKQEAVLLGALSQSESGGDPSAYNNSGRDNSLGLLQVNMHAALGPERLKQFNLTKPEELFNPDTNVRAGLEILRTQGPTAWTAYKSGAYKKYMPQSFSALRPTPQTAASDMLGNMSMSPIGDNSRGYNATASVNPRDVANPGIATDAPMQLPGATQTAQNNRQLNDSNPTPRQSQPQISLDAINAERTSLANTWNNTLKVAAMPSLGDGGWRMVQAKQEQIKLRLQQLDAQEKQFYENQRFDTQREDTNQHWSIDREDKKQAPINEMFLKKYQSISDAGDKAVPKLQTLKSMQKLLDDPNFYSGTGAEAVTSLRKLSSSLGITDNVSSPNELFSALQRKLTLEANNGSLGSGVSNADVSFISSISPSEQMTPQAAKALTGYLIAVEENRKLAKKAANQYAEKNGLGFGFDNFMSDWADEHQVITPQLEAAITQQPQQQQAPQQPKIPTAIDANGNRLRLNATGTGWEKY
jgi:hypothetical protein